MRKSLHDRFIEKTEADPTTGCRLWQGATSRGRGIMHIAGKTRLASHVAVELATERTLPRGAWVRPSCGRKNCVASDHLAVDSPCGRGVARDKVPIGERLRALTVIDPETGCHLYTGRLDNAGYGRFHTERKWRRAHRVAYALRYGPIEDGMICRHKCDVPNCINPDHLELGSHLDNQRDRKERARDGRTRFATRQLKATDRAMMLAAREAGYSFAAVCGGWALSESGAIGALAKARNERAAAEAAEDS